MLSYEEFTMIVETILKIIWEHTPSISKFVFVFFFLGWAFIIISNPQDSFGLFIAFLFMLPTFLIVFVLSVAENIEKVSEKDDKAKVD
jgi:hypothetical protein